MIAGNVDHLNRMFAEAEQKPIRFGIGIHAGDAIVGHIGYRDTVVFTALGDAVNVTARLEQLTKELDCQVVFSDFVLKTARLPPDALPIAEVTIRGRADPLVVRTVVDAAMLASVLDTHSETSMARPKQPEAENHSTL
jgi:adenylate cyclase